MPIIVEGNKFGGGPSRTTPSAEAVARFRKWCADRNILISEQDAKYANIDGKCAADFEVGQGECRAG